MGMKSVLWGLDFILFTLTLATAQEDSLQSALNAVNRRQRDLSELPGYGDFYADEGLTRYSYSPDEREELNFLTPDDYINERKNKASALDRVLLDYAEDDGLYGSDNPNRDDGIKKRISSSFRERIEEDKAKQREEERRLNKMETEDDEEYVNIIQELWEKYRNAYPEVYDARTYPKGDAKKRSYPILGWDSVGMRKRSRYFEPDGPSEALYLLNYAPRDEVYNRLQEEDNLDNSDPGYWNLHKHLHRERKRDRFYQTTYPMNKRFPVAKRSSNPMELTHQHKRSPRKDIPKTDPKVAKELGNIFGVVQMEGKKKRSEKVATKPKQTEHAIFENKTNGTKKNVTEKRPNTKEIAPVGFKEDSLQIKKKSIDWSDYFGYDRKKKSKNDEIDKEWLMERYHKAVAMATKRSNEYPLENFRNHDSDKNKKDISSVDQEEIDEMDSKLKNIEDLIVDEALKYTGAHEGITDSKEVQEVKDRVISRLAAAYSLEKMRRALDDYKMSIEREKDKLNQANKQDDNTFLEEKRVSVPRKQAVDEEREKTPEGDNNIKCAHNDEDCEEQTYRPSSDAIEESTWSKASNCPKVERACNKVTEVLGYYGKILEAACNVHQFCLLCGDNSWFSPTRQCNFLFLMKADELCDGNLECQNIARRSIRYFLDINRSLRVDSSEECDLAACPDNRR